MNEMRILLQSKLEEIQDLEVSPEIPDTMLVEGKTYFSFSLQKVYVNSDTGRNYTYQISMIGYIKRLNNQEENTLEIVDNMADRIENKLKEINMKTTFYDVSILDGIKKIQVSGDVLYNEINNRLA